MLRRIIELLDFLFAEFANAFGRIAEPQFAAFDGFTRRHDGTRTDKAVFPDDGAVEYRGAHADQAGIFDHAGMDHGGMDMSGMDGMMSQADMDALKNADGVQAAKLYLTGMIKHHQGALTMAQDEIKNGQSTDAIALAKSILESQQKEIDTMNQILSSL